ncbi:MAG TPA: hypothetical protein VFY20_07285 [Gemmatimonadales bacterium]|nr:hypothetical protein [Gemmatimonadales bacterium]
MPPCRRMGRQCHALDVILRIGEMEPEAGTSLDQVATWLLGHTQHMSFGTLEDSRGQLYVEATLHVPCRHYRETAPGVASCSAHAFTGEPPRRPARRAQPRQLGGDRFVVVDRLALVTGTLRHPPRELPIVTEPDAGNPCEGVPCRTSDLRRGAACCRDLRIEIMCTPREKRLEALVRSRRAPYLGRTERIGASSLEADMISACGYLEPGGVACTLHGRKRADGRSAKPDLCFAWPPKDEQLHKGCVFASTASARPPVPLTPAP